MSKGTCGTGNTETAGSLDRDVPVVMANNRTAYNIYWYQKRHDLSTKVLITDWTKLFMSLNPGWEKIQWLILAGIISVTSQTLLLGM